MNAHSTRLLWINSIFLNLNDVPMQTDSCLILVLFLENPIKSTWKSTDSLWKFVNWCTKWIKYTFYVDFLSCLPRHNVFRFKKFLVTHQLNSDDGEDIDRFMDNIRCILFNGWQNSFWKQNSHLIACTCPMLVKCDFENVVFFGIGKIAAGQ